MGYEPVMVTGVDEGRRGITRKSRRREGMGEERRDEEVDGEQNRRQLG